MPVELKRFVQDGYAASREAGEVDRIAAALLEHLSTPAADAKISVVNQPGAASQRIQEVFMEFAHELGFVDERVGLFAKYESAVRPDYFLKLPTSGILLEVERGKTTINNMDFLDFWKCHLCEQAHYLFLLVPKELRQNPTMAPQEPKQFERNRTRRRNFLPRPADLPIVPKLILFRCGPLSLDDVAKVVKTDNLDDVVFELHADQPVVVLIGPRVSASVAREVIDAVASTNACFLRVREGDSPGWLRRLVRTALKPR